MAKAYYWFCCNCIQDKGPHSYANMPQCHCGHVRCSECVVELREAVDMDSDNEDNVSVSGDFTCETYLSSSLRSQSYPSNDATVPFTNLTQDGLKADFSLVKNLPKFSFPLGQGGCGFPHLRTPSYDSYTPIQHDPQGGGKEVKYVWYCSNCGDGPHNYNISPACSECGHYQCSACTVVAVKP